MKRILALALCLMLLTLPAAADFDMPALLQQEGAVSFPAPGSWDTVVRFSQVPFMGESDQGTVTLFLDYVEKVDVGAVLVRVMISTMTYDALWADEAVLEVGGKRYVFATEYQQSEYDGVYMEDYTFCLAARGMEMLKGIARQKKDEPIPVTLRCDGETVLTGRLLIPGADAAAMYDRFVDLGGKAQGLKELDDMFSCQVEKVK